LIRDKPRPPGGQADRIFRGHQIEAVAERDDHHSEHRRKRLAAVMRQSQSARHHSEAEPADRARHHEAVLENPAAERDRRQRHRERQTNFVDHRRAEEASSRGHERQQHRRGDAMHQAQARKAHREPVQAGSG
jgi:hypothetical protein